MFRSALIIFSLALLFACGGGGSSEPEEVSVFADFVEGPLDSRGSPDAVLHLRETFDSGFNPLWNGAFIWENNYVSGAGKKPVRQPSSDEVFNRVFLNFSGRGRVLHYLIPQGKDEVTPVMVGAQEEIGMKMVTGARQIEEFYLEWEELYTPGHDFANGSQKLTRYSFSKGSQRGPHVDFWIQNNNSTIQLFLFHPGNGEPIEHAVNTSFGVPVGEWIRFGVWVRLNDPGRSNGFGRAYLNDRLIIDIDQVSIRGEDSRGFNQMALGMNHSNRGLTTQESSRYIDNVEWWSSRPKASTNDRKFHILGSIDVLEEAS